MLETIFTLKLCVVCNSVVVLIGAAVIVYVEPEVNATVHQVTAAPAVVSMVNVRPPQKDGLPYAS